VDRLSRASGQPEPMPLQIGHPDRPFSAANFEIKQAMLLGPAAHVLLSSASCVVQELKSKEEQS
jgi:hypothetical protein